MAFPVSGNSAGGRFDPDSYDRELRALRDTLDGVDVVGHVRRDAELAELKRLARKYPEETRRLLDQATRPAEPPTADA